MAIRSVNPATEQVIAEYAFDDADTVDHKLSRARQTFEQWCDTDFDHRSRLLGGVADLLDERRDTYAKLMTDEMGKPISQARGEVDKCAWACRYFADQADTFLAPEPHESDGSRAFVRHDPLGPIFAVMPWNFPFWQVFRFAAPNLMAGNVGVLSHSHNVGGCASALQDIFEEAGFPEGAFQSLFIPNDLSADVIASDHIRGVTLTGSVPAGRAIAEAAGAQIKPSVLELGGSDPFIVLDDGDVDQAVDNAVHARLLNNGQSCIAAKRFIIEDGIYDDFIAQFRDGLAHATMGDPRDPATDLGPMARDDLRQGLHRQVQQSVELGATCQLGGQLPEGAGFYYPATLLTDCTDQMPAFGDETFGPVAAVTRVGDAHEALSVANASRFGLGASIWTTSERGVELAEHLQAGHVAVNGIVKSDPRLPFGGIKESGYGRELSRRGILEFVNEKTVWVG